MAIQADAVHAIVWGVPIGLLHALAIAFGLGMMGFFWRSPKLSKAARIGLCVLVFFGMAIVNVAFQEAGKAVASTPVASAPVETREAFVAPPAPPTFDDLVRYAAARPGVVRHQEIVQQEGTTVTWLEYRDDQSKLHTVYQVVFSANGSLSSRGYCDGNELTRQLDCRNYDTNYVFAVGYQGG